MTLVQFPKNILWKVLFKSRNYNTAPSIGWGHCIKFKHYKKFQNFFKKSWFWDFRNSFLLQLASVNLHVCLTRYDSSPDKIPHAEFVRINMGYSLQNSP